MARKCGLTLLCLVVAVSCASLLVSCGSGGENVCKQAWDLRCACPGTTCEGDGPDTCGGKLEEEAECTLQLSDPCDYDAYKATCVDPIWDE